MEILNQDDAEILEMVSLSSSFYSAFIYFSSFSYNKQTYHKRDKSNKRMPFSHLPRRDRMQKNDEGVT